MTGKEARATTDDVAQGAADLQETVAEIDIQGVRLDAQRAPLAAILSSLRDGVLLVDLDGGTILSNEAYERIAASGHPELEDDEGRPVATADGLRARAARGESFTGSVPDDPIRRHAPLVRGRGPAGRHRRGSLRWRRGDQGHHRSQPPPPPERVRCDRRTRAPDTLDGSAWLPRTLGPGSIGSPVRRWAAVGAARAGAGEPTAIAHRRTLRFRAQRHRQAVVSIRRRRSEWARAFRC